MRKNGGKMRRKKRKASRKEAQVGGSAAKNRIIKREQNV